LLLISALRHAALKQQT